ncbi:Meiotically Up-regulated Gene 113 (MUG113) protein [Prosthecobacter fusiformis]|uniref:Meiotically Up-regulated Gene 113 (MUG113) protein n=2 Tax=Prosthecobacter fusiformis TaxID=48464 RepID=A0A4R7RJA2_9BACT|nr:Meiotically Up-regulated Gene 113 (MUG113) protein [Prosthecobacter fusiformis]
MKDDMSEIDLDELRSELDDFALPEKAGGSSAREQRIIAGFEEIERFVEQHGRRPEHGEDRDIFERLYAVRLERLRASQECREVLKGRDSRGLLRSAHAHGTETGGVQEEVAEYRVGAAVEAVPSDDELLNALRGEDVPGHDLTQLRHVRSREEIRAAEEVAQRNPCNDFDVFRPIFEVVQHELATGKRQTLKYKDNADVKNGDLFILDGQKVIVADMGEPFVSDYGRPDRRLRVIYDNGTESDLLVRSLQRALNKDKASRRITEPDLGPLFSDEEAEGDLSAGVIYVLRSLSENSFIAKNRSVIHKIGVTGGDVGKRIVNAKKDPTYLLADVEVVELFKLVHINRKLLEAMIHKFFASARLDMELKDRFGGQVEPREWFLVPLPVIEEAIQKLREGSIGNYRYDPATAQIVEV